MREDMFKVIVERPRRGGHDGVPVRARLRGEDDLPTKIGMNRHVALIRGYETKSLNENLKPLKRFLQKQVGRPWNKVFSEIAATLASGHTVKEHVRLHIDDFVQRKIAIGRFGEWLDGGRTWGDRTYPWRQEFFVDPRDGILKDSKKFWKKRGVDLRRTKYHPKGDPNVIKLDRNSELRRVDGVWYEIGYSRDPDALPTTLVTDLVSRERVSARSRHAAHKRQLPKAELEARGLINEPPE